MICRPLGAAPGLGARRAVLYLSSAHAMLNNLGLRSRLHLTRRLADRGEDSRTQLGHLESPDQLSPDPPICATRPRGGMVWLGARAPSWIGWISGLVTSKKYVPAYELPRIT